MVEALLVFSGVVVTAVFGWLATKATSKSNAEVARGPDWQGFTDKIMAAHKTEMDLQDERHQADLAIRDERLAVLDAQMSRMQDALRVMEGKYHWSIQHIREWRRMFPDEGPPVPAQIREDLG